MKVIVWLIKAMLNIISLKPPWLVVGGVESFLYLS